MHTFAYLALVILIVDVRVRVATITHQFFFQSFISSSTESVRVYVLFSNGGEGVTEILQTEENYHNNQVYVKTTFTIGADRSCGIET